MQRDGLQQIKNWRKHKKDLIRKFHHARAQAKPNREEFLEDQTEVYELLGMVNKEKYSKPLSVLKNSEEALDTSKQSCKNNIKILYASTSPTRQYMTLYAECTRTRRSNN